METSRFTDALLNHGGERYKGRIIEKTLEGYYTRGKNHSTLTEARQEVDNSIKELSLTIKK